MHTHYSDGTGTVMELAQAAKQSGLQWIWITDHDTMAGKPDEGMINGVATLIGYEITPQRNHYLVGNMDELVSPELPPAEFVAEVAKRGGVGIVAHPDERAVNEYKQPYRWDDWSIRGFTGIELWNYMSDWIEHYSPRTKPLNYFFPARALKGPTADTIRWWEKLQLEGQATTGVFGVDAHAHKVRQVGREWVVFPYRHCFSQLVNYLQLDAPLSQDFIQAQSQIWQAIRQGRVIMANQARGNAAGTTFVALPRGSDADKAYTCGDKVPLGQGVRLEFICPQPAELYLYHNGALVVRTTRSQSLRFDCTTPGHYRIEAHRRSLWIMTNHIHLYES
jgi:hypothetical protein